MVWRVGVEWESRLCQLLGERRSDPPVRIIEVHAAQAMIHRRRILARPREAWLRLRNHAASIQFHSEADLALEGAFHYILGERWCRRFVEENLELLRSGRANELECRAGAACPSVTAAL